MNIRLSKDNVLSDLKTSDLWIELAKRLGVRFGRIQMSVHDGRPSKYATIDMKVCTDDPVNGFESNCAD